MGWCSSTLYTCDGATELLTYVIIISMKIQRWRSCCFFPRTTSRLPTCDLGFLSLRDRYRWRRSKQQNLINIRYEMDGMAFIYNVTIGIYSMYTIFFVLIKSGDWLLERGREEEVLTSPLLHTKPPHFPM